MARKIKKAKKSGKKLLKAHKPTPEDLSRKSKRTGYRFKTDHLKKKNGEPTKLAKKLRFKKPTTAEIEKYKKNPDGTYPDKTKEIYHERRADRKHSDDNLKKKFDGGGAVENKWTEIRSSFLDEDGTTFIDGYLTEDDNEQGKVIAKVNKDGEVTYLDEWAKKSPYAQEVINEIVTEIKGVKKDKLEDGGDVKDIKKGWLTIFEVKEKLGRDLHWWKDDVVILNGEAFEKVFLQPFYKPVEIPEEQKVVNIDLTQPAI